MVGSIVYTTTIKSLFVLNRMGNRNRLVGLLGCRLGNALQKGLQCPIEVSGILFEERKSRIFFHEQIVNDGRRRKRIRVAAAIGQDARRCCQDSRIPKADPNLAGCSHGMEFVCELHALRAALGGGFLEDLEQETGVS